MSRSYLVKREGYTTAVTAADKTKLEPMGGILKKKNHWGFWQARYYALNNGYLNYYTKSKEEEPLGSIDLSVVESAELLDLAGGMFQLIFMDDSETPYTLKATNSRNTADWLDALEARIQWAKEHPPGTGAAGKRTGGKGGKAAAAGTDDEEDEDEKPTRGRGGAAATGKGGKGGKLAAAAASAGTDDDEDDEGGKPARGGRGGASGSAAAGAKKPSSAPSFSAGRRNTGGDDDDEDDEEGDKPARGGRGSAAVAATGKGGKGGNTPAVRAGKGGRAGGDDDEDTDDDGKGSGNADNDAPGRSKKPALGKAASARGTGLAGGRRGGDDTDENSAEGSDDGNVKKPSNPFQARGGRDSVGVGAGKGRGGGAGNDDNDDDVDSDAAVGAAGRNNTKKASVAAGLAAGGKRTPYGRDNSEEDDDEDDSDAASKLKPKPKASSRTLVNRRGGDDDDDDDSDNAAAARRKPGASGKSTPAAAASAVNVPPAPVAPVVTPLPELSLPEEPAHSGWVKKKAQTRMGDWQMRFLDLEKGILYWYDKEEDVEEKEFSQSLDVDSIEDVRAKSEAELKTLKSKEIKEARKTFIVMTEDNEIELRADDEASRDEWIEQIQQARDVRDEIRKLKAQRVRDQKAWKVKEADASAKHKEALAAWKAKYGNAAAAAGSKAGASSAGSDDSDDGGRGKKKGGRGGAGADSDGDSDADSDNDASKRLPPAPKWFKDYESNDEARWMMATQRLLSRLFENIVEEQGDAESGAGDRKVVVSKLADATTRACAELEDRVMQCRRRGRADVIKHMIQMYDIQFLQEITPFNTGLGPTTLSPKQLLQLIDCIEGYMNVRKRSVGAMTLSSQEKRPGHVLRETRRDLMSRYTAVMGPKLHGIAEKVLRNLFDKKADLVKRTVKTRIGTSSPTDLFNLMSEHLKIAREGGSYSLQRLLLSAVITEVTFYAGEVLGDLMDWWAKDPNSVDMDFCTAVINDSGVMLDHLEQLEAYFAEALRKESEEVSSRTGAGAAGGSSSSSSSGKKGGSGNNEEDEFENKEEEEAAEVLAAIRHDLPYAKNQLLHSGCQLAGVLVDIVTADFRIPLSELFSSKWEAGNQMSTIAVTASDYLTEERDMLDEYFYERFVGQVAAHLVEQYVQRLINGEALKKDKRSGFQGGFSSKFKLNEQRLTKLVADVVELTSCFASLMPREDIVVIAQPLSEVRDMLTIEPDNLPSVLELAIKSHTEVSTHVFLAFEKVVAMREDLNKSARKSAIEMGTKLLREYGQPPEDPDEFLLSTGGMLGAGVMHGATMSQQGSWSPASVPDAIYRGLFPNAWERAKTLFAGWEPPAAPVVTQTSSGPAAFSLDSFMGGKPASSNDGGGESTGDMSAFLNGGASGVSKSGGGGGASKTKSRADLGRAYNDDDDEEAASASAAAAPAKNAFATTSKKGISASPAAPVAAAPKEAALAPESLFAPRSGAAGGAGARDRRRRGRGRGDDDDDE